MEYSYALHSQGEGFLWKFEYIEAPETIMVIIANQFFNVAIILIVIKWIETAVQLLIEWAELNQEVLIICIAIELYIYTLLIGRAKVKVAIDWNKSSIIIYISNIN